VVAAQRLYRDEDRGVVDRVLEVAAKREEPYAPHSVAGFQ
jgi:hypothetical protein